MDLIGKVKSPSAKRLGCWQLLAVEYTAVFSDGLEPEPSRVRTIRMFDPYYVPLLVRRTFQAPTGGVDTFGYHVIGRHITVMPAGDTRLPLNLASIPTGWPYATGTIYAQRTWSQPWKHGSVQYRNGFPDIYLAHNEWLVKWMRACHDQMFTAAEDVRKAMMRQFKEDVLAEQRALDQVQSDRRAALHEEKSELHDAIENEIHWMRHPRQRPAPPEPKGFTEVRTERVS